MNKNIQEARTWLLPGVSSAILYQAESRRIAQLKLRLKNAAQHLLRRSPNPRTSGLIREALALLQSAPSQAALSHPTFSLWLEFTASAAAEKRNSKHPSWGLLISHLFGFALSEAIRLKRTFSTVVLADAYGHVHLNGLSAFLDYGQKSALRPVLISVDKKRNLPLRALPLIAGKIELDCCNPLLLDRATEHGGVARPDMQELSHFRQVIEQGLKPMQKLNPALFQETCSFMRILVPLKTPKNLTSASSSYRDLPMTIYLSHCEDPLVQAETLVHESSHAKLNLIAGQQQIFSSPDKALYYSPLKDFPRPLYYVFFAAHAFLNTASYLIQALKNNACGEQKKQDVELYISRRMFEVKLELEVLSQHAQFTPFGAEMHRQAWREMPRLLEAISHFDPSNLAEAKNIVETHRQRFTQYPSLLYQKSNKRYAIRDKQEKEGVKN